MINNNKIWIMIILFCSLINIYQYFDNQHLSNERDKAYIEAKDLSVKITNQNDAIQQLVLAQKEKESTIIKAQEDAAKLRNEYDKAAKEVLAQKVPKKCDEAVRWGAAQGHAIYECWAVGC